jgi:hypothetical protein
MKNTGTVLVLLLTALALTACAGKRNMMQKIQFQSNPTGATVTTTAGTQCVTPCSLKLMRNESTTVTFSKDSCMDKTVALTAAVDPTGRLVGTRNDMDSGRAYSLTPDLATATLACMPAVPVLPVTQHPPQQQHVLPQTLLAP